VRLAVVRFAVRLAVVRLAVVRLAVARLAVARLAVVRFAPARLAVARLAVVRLAVVRFAAVLFRLPPLVAAAADVVAFLAATVRFAAEPVVDRRTALARVETLPVALAAVVFVLAASDAAVVGVGTALPPSAGTRPLPDRCCHGKDIALAISGDLAH
jgi:hypothetical protein